jgi:hypothetical protein
MQLQARSLPNFVTEARNLSSHQRLSAGENKGTGIMNKTLALLMRVILAATVLVMATATSKHVAAGMAKHVRMDLKVEPGTDGHAPRSGS